MVRYRDDGFVGIVVSFSSDVRSEDTYWSPVHEKVTSRLSAERVEMIFSTYGNELIFCIKLAQGTIATAEVVRDICATTLADERALKCSVQIPGRKIIRSTRTSEGSTPVYRLAILCPCDC